MQKPSFRKKVIRVVMILILVGIVGTLTYYVRTHSVEVSKDVSMIKTNLLGKYFGTTTAKVSEDVQVVKTATIQVGAIAVKNTYSGDVQGLYDTPLSFQVTGKVIKRNVDSGSIVHSGDVLLALDTQDYEQTVNIASAQLDTANSKLKLAEITLNRNRELLKGGAIGQAAFDVCQNDFDSAQAAVKLASSQYQQNLDQLNYCSLHAGCDGVVTAVNVEVGQVVAVGTP
ncbi:efflux RND transporter periplasmic adaptor subunit, partial [Desulfosporosinus sp. OT]|uniref:efflux RND transporter periplasmic adaptor subunit n=1 Tax=Desulfosporosinus sp. OT TaxID=913865 RepID=UPI000223ACBA